VNIFLDMDIFIDVKMLVRLSGLFVLAEPCK